MPAVETGIKLNSWPVHNLLVRMNARLLINFQKIFVPSRVVKYNANVSFPARATAISLQAPRASCDFHFLSFYSFLPRFFVSRSTVQPPSTPRFSFCRTRRLSFALLPVISPWTRPSFRFSHPQPGPYFLHGRRCFPRCTKIMKLFEHPL